jgi:hypothetical protein
MQGVNTMPEQPKTAEKPPVASSDAAWVSLPTPLPPARLAELCRDIEAIFRVNPYYYFKAWRQTGATAYAIEFENQSNQAQNTLVIQVSAGPGPGFTVHYDHGLKKRTVFTIEPASHGSQLTVTDDYESAPLLPAAEALVVATGVALVPPARVGPDETVGAAHRVAALPDHGRGVLLFPVRDADLFNRTEQVNTQD